MKYQFKNKILNNQRDYIKALKESDDRCRTYDLWDDTEESELIKLSETMSISELADYFKRVENAIIVRLERLVLENEICIELHSNGLKKKEELYKNNQLCYSTMWFDNAQKESEGNYEICYEYSDVEPPIAVKVGKWISWYKNGQKKSEGDYYNCWKDSSLGNFGIKSVSPRDLHDGIYDITGTNDLSEYNEDWWHAKVGKWTELYENGQKKSEGEYKDLYYDGKWTFWYENGQKMSEGNYKNGYQYGEHIEWYKNGQKSSVIFYKEISKDEQHKKKKPSFDYSNYDSIDNDDNEQHWSFNCEPRCEVNNYKSNFSWYGKCTEWYANGQKESERTYDDNGNFKLIVWYEDGQVKLEEFYKNGEKDGKCTYWYENGEQKSEYNYINGSETGNFIEWYINGNKYREWHSLDFLDGHSKDNGTLTQWDENGQLKSIKYQKDRGNYELIERYENGQIKTQGSYKKYRKNGKHIEWHKNGQKKSEENYKDGYLEGKSTTWYDNGQKKSEGNYVVDLDSHQFLGGNASVRDGKWTEWYEDGKEKPEKDCLDNDFLEKYDENDKPIIRRFSEFDDDIPF